MGAVNLRNPLISAPEAEQSVVSPFLLRRRPNRRSPAFAAVFGSPLSGSPIPGSHADVTILLPGNGPQSPGAPTNTNGTARSPSSSSRSANAGAAGTTATNTTAIKRRILNIIALSFESRTSSLESTNRQRRGEWLDRSSSLLVTVETVWLCYRVVLTKVNAQRCDATSVRPNFLPSSQRVTHNYVMESGPPVYRYIVRPQSPRLERCASKPSLRGSGPARRMRGRDQAHFACESLIM